MAKILLDRRLLSRVVDREKEEKERALDLYQDFILMHNGESFRTYLTEIHGLSRYRADKLREYVGI